MLTLFIASNICEEKKFGSLNVFIHLSNSHNDILTHQIAKEGMKHSNTERKKGSETRIRCIASLIKFKLAFYSGIRLFREAKKKHPERKSYKKNYDHHWNLTYAHSIKKTDVKSETHPRERK